MNESFLQNKRTAAIGLLNQAIGVLKKVEASSGDNTINMDAWLTDEGDTTVKNGQKHFCGTAACICGYMALDETRPPPKRSDEVAYEDWFDEIVKNSKELSKGFNALLGLDLGKSVWHSDHRDRGIYAEWSNFFSEEELKHPHLNGQSSLADAISYLQLIQTKI